MAINYEWDIEEMEGNEEGDIRDHNFRDKLSQFSSRELNEIDGKKYVLVLVRPETETAFKGWAYAEKKPWEDADGTIHQEWTLPEYFLDAMEKPVCMVPERFHRELSIMQEDGKWYREQASAA